ncbi:MAG TPA: HDIG domain-containing protein [Myxococcaceae bacterium]|nr:HDIG domain-containing protein [Myxococcaceae bacterium]
MDEDGKGRWRSGLRQALPALTLLAVVSVLSGLLVAPGFAVQTLPQLRPEDVGRPFESTSAAGYKATRDYDIPDAALTDRRRQDARASVRPVFDFNPAVVPEVQGAVQEAFAALRIGLTHLEAPAKPGPARRRPEPPDATALAQARQTFEQRLFEVEDEDWKALVDAHASPEVEHAVLSVLSRGYLGPVVGAREDLGPPGSFLTIRDLGDGAEHPSAVSPPAVLDVREARAEMDRWATLPGNVLPDAPALLRRAVLRIAKRALRPNLTANIAETERRRAVAAALVKDAVIQIKKGQKIIGDGELVTPDHLRMLAAMRAQTDRFDVVEATVGTAALVALLLGGIWTFHRKAFRRFRPTRRDGLLLGVLLVVLLATFRLAAAVAEALHDRWPVLPMQALLVLLPIAAGAMLVRLLLNQELALFFGLVLSTLVGVMLGNSLFFAVYGLLGSLVAATHVARARDRAALFRSGAWVGFVNAGVVLAFGLAAGKGSARDALLAACFAGLGSALVVPTLALALTPLLESSFGYASDLKLLELANLNHPALKELIVQSPGTYHHSIIVGSLVEAAAEATGCNPLLSRTCAYYHDIGKGKNPLYFGENQKGENPHDCLAPGMSAVIIKRHVTDGLELARRYKLPRAVQDVIAQHHGTRLVGYFHHKATKEAEGREGAVDDALFRYTGPRPQFREAALVMLADAVEAASRAMPEPTSERLRALVQRIITVVFTEGQLDECDLTLRDLNAISVSFLHTLEGIYHSRPAYPPGAFGAGRPGGLALAPEGRTQGPVKTPRPEETRRGGAGGSGPGR